jgi:hypothetical protein
MHYLVKFRTERLANIEHLGNWDNVYLTPEGDRGWTILEAEDEDALRHALEGQEVKEAQPMLPAREYIAISEARTSLENYKARFVDDPTEALTEARRAVDRALEARGYPKPEQANEASTSRQEVLQEYRRTDTAETGNLEAMREAFTRLSDLLERIART